MTGRLVGVEHELRLWRGGEQADFRGLVTEVAGHLRTLDPGDPRARRLPSGTALTADGREAELATPPLAVGPDTPGRLDRLLRAERSTLVQACATRGVTGVTGFSTHLNVSVPDDEAVGLARRLVEHAAVALGAALEPRGTSGLLVRPRRGRLELCGEYAEGPDLVAGLTLLLGCVAALEADAEPASAVPPTTEPAREKFGWFVPPAALLTARDRDALAESWTWARPFAVAAGLDPAPVDDLDAGTRPLRRDRDDDPARCTLDPRPGGATGATSTGPRDLRDGVRAETEWLTWQHAVWVFRAPTGASCRAVVPADQEGAFLRQLDDGDLDAALRRMLRRPVRPRRLVVHAQVGTGLLWHQVRPGALVPAERQRDGSVPRVSRRAARRALAGAGA